MATIPANGVLGTDGVYPLIEDEPLWRMWQMSQIYLGQAANGRYVPKIKDWVCDPDTGEVWVVDHLDPISLIPTLRPIDFSAVSGNFDIDGGVVATGPGAPSDVYRVYVNSEVFPHTVQVDAAVYVRGQNISHYKLFSGYDTSETTGKVISKRFDGSNNFISNSIPLDLAELDSHVNYFTKCFRRCHCTEDLANDELVTAVIYADDGHVVYKRQLFVEITNTISDSHAGVKYITDISLESIWLSATTADTIEFPLNIPMNALNMTGVVLYSDGSTARYPVNGDKFAMPGLNGYLSSIPGHPADLVLRYTLSPGEQAYAVSGANNTFITKPYKIITTNENKSIAVKLFGYPEWANASLGYRMRWFLMNVERNFFFDVSSLVTFSQNTGPFEPKLWGVTQRKSVSINLAEVSPAFMPFVHTQVVDIVLYAPPTNDLVTAWTVSNGVSSEMGMFGDGLYGRIQGNLVNLKSGQPDLDTWLAEVYRKTSPLVDVGYETEAPTPTHFITSYEGNDVEYAISQWDQPITIGNAVTYGKNVTIRFIKKTANATLQLGVASIPLKFIL